MLYCGERRRIKNPRSRGFGIIMLKNIKFLSEQLENIQEVMSRIKMVPENAVRYERDGDLVLVHTAPSAFSLLSKKK